MEYSKSIQDFGLKSILITGGCGFIGTNLTRYLADKGYRIRILDNLSTGKKEYLDALNLSEAPELLIEDIRNEEAAEKAVESMDAVVHLAAHTSVVDSLENPKETWDINVVGTLNLLEACRQNGVAKFIFASSNAVVGEQPPPIDESKIPKPSSPYGASKLAVEALCSAYYHSFGLKTISLRFANCYGPYCDHISSVTTRFMRWTKEGKPLIIYGDGNQTRDFVHVDDVCQAIYLSLTIPDSGLSTPDYGEVFQIASGIETSINELAEMIKEMAGNKPQIIYEAERKGEIRRNYSDITKARRVLGFEPKIKLREGLKELWELHTTKLSGIISKSQ